VSTRFTRAVLRRPGENFAAGLTSATAGPPVLATALEQHALYAAALRACGLALEILPADSPYPDGTFVEDTAVLTPTAAIVTRPGAASRAGETAAIAAALARHYDAIAHITAPGTVDGGDVCETDTGFLIGLTARTNEAGARQLAGLLGEFGHAATLLDVRGCAGLLHLKTGISYLGEGRLAVAAGLPRLAALEAYEQVTLVPAEGYAANCVRVNDRVLVAAGYPRFADALVRLGYDPLPLPMSEFRKMDGGLSCLSLRF
jgi:dimethylargininase